VPQTHTVFADVHAPFTHESVYASTGASIVCTQPQTTTVTTQSQSAMHAQLAPNLAVNFNALPTGLTATADTVVLPPTAMPPPMPLTTIHSTPAVAVPQIFSQSVPTFIVKQPQMPKPYSGGTSYQSFMEHFERICRVNAWTTTEDKVQTLTLALEGPAAEILKILMKQAQRLTTKFGHCWPVDSDKQMRLEMQCAVSIIDDRLITSQYQSMHRPFVCFIEKHGLMLPQARETLT